MDTLFLLLMCLPAVFATVWAHYRLNTHSPSTRWVTSGFLIVIGFAFGWVMAFLYTESQGLDQVLTFIFSFGLVHMPAAVILQLKHWRGGVSEKD